VGLKPISVANWLPSVLCRCWLGHLAIKIVLEMTYKVSSGTLNLYILTHSLLSSNLSQAMTLKVVELGQLRPDFDDPLAFLSSLLKPRL